MYKKSIIMVTTAALASSANLPVEAQTGPTLAETVNYIAAKCNGKTTDDRYRNQRFAAASERVSIGIEHRSGCESYHDETWADFDVRAVKFSSNDGRVQISCVKAGAGDAQCILTNTGHPQGNGMSLRDGPRSCSVRLESKSVQRTDISCDDPVNVVRAFQQLQRYNGGQIQEYSDPFAN